ncbi:MAG: ABC transporter substrate-binding protein, partial [Candidatus Thiodiazotropha sp.]
ASLLDQPERGESLIGDMQRRLAQTADHTKAERPSALFYQPRGYTSGKDTLQDEALRLAGWRNLAAEQGIEGYAPVDLERLLLWHPQRIFTSDYDASGDSLAQRGLDHPVLERLLAGRPLLRVPYKYWICPGPMLAQAVDAVVDPGLAPAQGGRDERSDRQVRLQVEGIDRLFQQLRRKTGDQRIVGPLQVGTSGKGCFATREGKTADETGVQSLDGTVLGRVGASVGAAAALEIALVLAKTGLSLE